MASKVTLVITEGPYQGKRFVFEEAKVVRFGRASDCDVRFEDDRRMSRYHCELVVDPPEAQIYDLGSLHGTLVNGAKYGGRTERKVKKAVAKRQHSPIELEDGAEIRVGRNVIRVEIELDKTFVSDETEGATLLDDELDKTLLINNYLRRQAPSAAQPRAQRAAPSAQPEKTVVQPRAQRAAPSAQPVVQPRAQRAAPSAQPAIEPEKTVVQPRSRVPSADKTVVERASAQRSDPQQGKTVVNAPPVKPLYPHDAKTIVAPSSARQPYPHDAKTIVAPSVARPPHPHDAKTIVNPSAKQPGSQAQVRTALDARLRIPTDERGQRAAKNRQAEAPAQAHAPDKTVVERRPSALPANQPDKTVVERRPSALPAQAHAPDKTVVERRPSASPGNQLDKTVVERRPSALPAQAHAPDKTVVERRPSALPANQLDKTVVAPAQRRKQAVKPLDKTVVAPAQRRKPAAKPLDKTVVAPAQRRRPAAKPLDKTVVARSSSKKSAAAQPPPPVPTPARPVLTREQQEARSALLELLKDLKLKALNQDAKLGAYIIERRLGRGGFGKVFQARHRSTRERVAIKIMRPRAAVNEYVRESFKREIDSTRALFHPNIVQLLEDGSVGNMFYFMMEFCDAGSANHLRRKRGGKIPLAEALPIMKQILRGLSFIHERGYIHRDLKPDNILLTNTPNGVVAKIGDLGLTKGFLETGMNGGLTITGVRIGTGPYMSREQLTNFKYVEPVSDVWSIGATFYMMLTGKHPRQGPPNLKNYDLILKGKIIPIQQFESSIPFPIARIIDRALVVDTKKRYETATEMLNALERVRF